MNALLLHPVDTVAVVLEAVPAGGEAFYLRDGVEASVTAKGNIPQYHKIAVRSAGKGDSIYKYGEVIGRATADIDAGAHVHTHNLSDLAEESL